MQRIQKGDDSVQMLIQPQLEIGKEDDQFEREANSISESIMCSKEECGAQSMTDTDANNKSMYVAASSIQKMSDGVQNGMEVSPAFEQKISSSKGSGQALNSETIGEMGGKIGADFSNVNIHTDTTAAQMNKEIGAKAFTHGSDIYFNHGQYAPSTNEGKQLLAHELTHTIQQGQLGIRKKIQRQGGKIVDHQNLTTTIVAHIYYVPKTEENKNLPGGQSWFTEEEVQLMRTGVQKELTVATFYDFNNVDPLLGPHTVKFDIQFIPTASAGEATMNATYGPEGYKVNPDKSIELVPDKIPAVNTGMTLKKSQEEFKVLPDGSIANVKGGSTTGRLNVSSAEDAHNVVHELFHNLIHNHPNAPQHLKDMIDPANQEEGHKEAGGIFVYENTAKGRKRENLNQQNIDDALETLPVISEIEKTVIENKK